MQHRRSGRCHARTITTGALVAAGCRGPDTASDLRRWQVTEVEVAEVTRPGWPGHELPEAAIIDRPMSIWKSCKSMLGPFDRNDVSTKPGVHGPGFVVASSGITVHVPG